MKAKYLIYVVDDNQFNLLMVSTRLRRVIDCEVKTFENAESCMNALETQVPDLIVTDYHLRHSVEHGMNGNHMMQFIKEDYPDLPVIVYSHLQSIELAVEMMREGANDFVPGNRHFLNRIARSAKKELGRIKEEYQVVWSKRLIILLIAFFSGTLFLIYYTEESWLKYFNMFYILALTVIVFFGDKFFMEAKQNAGLQNKNSGSNVNT